ncbi:cytosolic sulfotransferase 8-like [Triticum dicoccoides]|uniref:Sulfotransferase n=1 Tax=Triticum turgidum subsp. durum TaxID=4567 RepID=A0A9R0SLX3_TRITD|nr:cytosolic sulfotransferase 8-like [Triticum dicoccoides]VAH97769.1 unnamed protein product [Triticum turgidum subsp. durum]
MAALDRSCLVGPVPFKDVNGDDDHVISPPDEYADIVSAFPSIGGPDLHLRLYQDVWLFNELVPGFISVQRRFTPRPRDVLLASPPKCGTTCLKVLAFATMARAAYPLSDADHQLLRLNPHECVPFMEALFSAGQEAKLDALPSPRLLHTHMHHSMLPRSLADNPDCKIIFVCREPKDMLVSTWHFIKSAGGNSNSSFSDLFELACEGKNPYGPIWGHILGYWRASKAAPGRVLFLRYEEMLADPVSAVRELARFLGVPFSPAEEAAGLPTDIAEMCSIDTMRGLDANKTGSSGTFVKFPHETFFRKGVEGDWVNHMTPEMARRIDAIVEDKLRGSGLTFSS